MRVLNTSSKSSDKFSVIKGLTKKEVIENREKYGENLIKKGKKKNPLKMLLSQFISPIILLLIFAALLSFSVNYTKHQDFFDSILIIIIVLAAGIAGFIQDYKAEKTVESLQKMAAPLARVIRDGIEQEISATDVVVGDILIISGGDIISADAKILSGSVDVNESILTGESKSKVKEKRDEIYSACAIYSGNIVAKVISVGINTKIGKIVEKMKTIDENQTPFQKHMKKFTNKIVMLTIAIIIITFIIAFKKFGVMEAGLLAVSLAVAAIPEDLPAVITIALSLGAKEMAKRNALVRRLAITESIGSVNIICTDKTGTITEGKMKVKDVWTIGNQSGDSKIIKDICFFCNNARTIKDSKNDKIKWVGDQTEIALKQFSGTSNLKGKLIKEVSFSSSRKMMSVVYSIDDKNIVFSKGAPEVLIEKCDRVLFDGKITKLNKKIKTEILEKNKEFASNGMRVLGLAYKSYDGPKSIEECEVFVGLAILLDSARKEVASAMKELYSAGIRVIMITGDNPVTAEAIGREVGLKTNSVLTGSELESISDEELGEKLNNGLNIFARTNPFHKLRILDILQKQGNVVAMTGDGVNDSLALKKADVGIAMGLNGSTVAKEASGIILLDDNFSSIRNAVKEGRRIFDNIRKFVDYLLTSNVAEVIVILIATILFPFMSLFPVQILWINLITDGLPALALSVDPARPNIMKRKPKKVSEGIINKKLAMLIFGIGIKKSIIILITFLLALYVFNLGTGEARTILFTGFIMYEFVRIGVIRYNEKLNSLKQWFSNKFLVYSLAASLLLQLFIIYGPIGNYFKVVPLSLIGWVILLSGTTVGYILGIAIAEGIDRISTDEY